MWSRTVRPPPSSQDTADRDGQPLFDDIAAAELLNVLRPTVGRFIVYAALALHLYPKWRDAFATGDEADLEPFVQEVRRFYLFFSVIGGKAITSFEWKGHNFAKGDWVVLDLYGTNHDPREWRDPGAFRPERFPTWDKNPDNFIPQGDGIHEKNHRCLGEWVTIALMKEAVRQLAVLRYDVPPQDLTVPMNRIPALPRSGFIMENVRLAEDSAGTGQDEAAFVMPR